MQFLKSLTFADSKRTFTKDVLLRVDLFALALIINLKNLQTELTMLNEKYSFYLTLDLWDNFIKEMTPVNDGQIAMFV